MENWLKLIKEVKAELATKKLSDDFELFEHFKFAANDLCKQDWSHLKFEHSNMKEAVNYYILNEMFNEYDILTRKRDFKSLARAMELDEDLRIYCTDHQNPSFSFLKYQKPFVELQDLMSRAVSLYEERNP